MASVVVEYFASRVLGLLAAYRQNKQKWIITLFTDVVSFQLPTKFHIFWQTYNTGVCNKMALLSHLTQTRVAAIQCINLMTS